MTRISEAALALITQTNATRHTEYLAQWNNNWNAYSLIGGHVEQGETFRGACLREITEELECTEVGIELAPYPYATLRFQEYSQAAKEQTDYHWQVFVARLTDDVLGNLPTDCHWVTADQIRSGSAADGKPIADQARRVLKAVDEAEFDLFVSYGHDDNTDDSVTALVEHIRREHERFAPTEPLKIFFDLWGIQNSDDWERRIYRGLIESKTMLAVLSPAYFSSEWCRREYDTFRQQQLKKLYPGEAVHAIYIQEHPDFETDKSSSNHPQQDWFDGLKKQQFEDAKPWWPDGQQALKQDVVVGRLNQLRQNIWKHVCDAKAIQHSPSNLSGFNVNFVGRERELTELWNTLRLDQAVAVSAIQGVGGLGKTALARAYAHTRRMDYLGGQFEIAMENVATTDGLKLEIVRLANLYLGANIPDETTNTDLNAAFAIAKAIFERPGRGKVLLILDNVAEEGVLSARATCLPSPEFVHVLATTRLDPERWGLNSLRLESLSTKDALDLFQKYRPFQTPDDTKHWNRILTNVETIAETDVNDDEWKAAVGIVNRLGGHALAIEVVAVYLGNNRSISLVDYLQGLIRKGLSVKLSQAGDDPAVKARLSAAVETNIGKLLEPTFERLEQENPLAMRVLEWAALMPPDHVPWTWLRDLIEQDHGDALQHDPDDPDPWTDRVVAQLTGWRLLTSDDNQLTAHIHRIAQTAISIRTAQSSASENTANVAQLLPYLELRSDLMAQNWGQPGVNWELTPLFEAAQMLLPSCDVHTGVLIERLIRPLRLDGQISRGLKLQIALMDRVEALCEHSPANKVFARALAICYHNMGDLFRALGNGTRAHEFHENALEVRERLVANTPECTDYTHALSKSCNMLGDLLRELGNGTQAHSYYEKALKLDQGLAAGSPENADFARSLGISYERLAHLEGAEGRFGTAVELLQKQLAITERFAQNASGEPDYTQFVAVTYNRLGDAFFALEDRTQARQYWEKALDIRERLVCNAPENADYASYLAVSYERMGDLFRALDNGTQAHEFYQQGLDVRERLAASAPENADYARDLSMFYIKMGDLHLKLNLGIDGRSFYVKALEVSERLVDIAPDNVVYAKGIWISCSRIAHAEIEAARSNEAQVWCQRAHDVLEELVNRGLIISNDERQILELFRQILEKL